MDRSDAKCLSRVCKAWVGLEERLLRKRAGEVAQQVKAVAAKPNDPSSVST